MSNAFNPSNPRYRRGVELLSCVLCTGIGAHVMMADFGTQEHIFSPLHRYVIPKLDLFFNVTMDDIKKSSTETTRLDAILKAENDAKVASIMIIRPPVSIPASQPYVKDPKSIFPKE
mmetsp:Transcript_8747/g.8664  ORF Transcript_8747/g.8664 Transcript_8747/m.8664 type:complete len:117 (+) Transcript_8747:110-460(+)